MGTAADFEVSSKYNAQSKQSLTVDNKIKKFSVGKICSSLNIVKTAKTGPGSKILDMIQYLSRDMRFPTMWYVRPAKAQTSLRICAV